MRFPLQQILTFLALLNICSATFVPEEHPGWKLLNETNCGHSMRSRIIGGKTANLGEYPWTVQIGTEGRTMIGSVQLFYCGGTIISRSYVVSAAHCIADENKRALNLVRAGEHDLTTVVDCNDHECAPPTQDRSIDKIFVHPKYNIPHSQNDIILIYVGIPFYISDFVRPICLLPSQLIENTFEDTTAEVAGWGVEDMDKHAHSTTLKVVSLPVLAHEECKNKFTGELTLMKTQLCSGGGLGKDSCSGDSGGPLMKAIAIDGPPRYFLIGVVSLGYLKCASTTRPGIFTRVSKYEKWILDMVAFNEKEINNR